MKLKIMAIMMVLVMGLSLFSGCGSDSSEEAAGTENGNKIADKDEGSKEDTTEKEVPKRTTLKIMMFGEEPLHFEEVLEEFYARTADTLNVELDIEFNPVPDHKQKLLLIASAGEEYDLVFDAPWMHIKTLAKDGAYVALDEYFNNDDYPGLKANFSEDYLNSNKFFDQIYGIPITHTITSSEGIGIRTDLMEKYGFDEIKDYETLQEFFDTIMENEPDMIPLAAEGRTGFFRMLHENFSEYNMFKAGDFLVALSEDNTEVLGAVYLHSGEMYGGDSAEYFANFPAPYNTEEKWYERTLSFKEWSKYLEEDVLTQKDPSGYFASGKAAALNRGYQDTNALETLKTNLGIETDLYAFPYQEIDRLQIEGKSYTDYKVWNFVCVPITSQKVDRTMDFLNWLYQSEENHYLFELGIEGTHWNAVGDNQYEVPASLTEPYVFPWYQLTGTPNMIKNNVTLPESAVEFNEWQANVDKYVLSPLAGFDMDYENVKAEKASIDAIYTNINAGVVVGGYDDPVAMVKEANEDAMKAGLDVMREETIKQVQAFLDSKK